LAVANYTDVNGHYPPAFQTGPDGTPWHSWRVLILPYIEQQELHKQYRFDEPWNGPHNREIAERSPRTLTFHGTKMPTTTTNYLAVVGPETMWPGAVGRKKEDVTSSTSDTIQIAENQGLGVHWMEPRDLHVDSMSYDFNSPEGLSSWYKAPSAAMADGSLRTFNEGYDAASLRHMLTATHPKPKPADPAIQPLEDGRKREKK
jgi:hypothetical protein